MAVSPDGTHFYISEEAGGIHQYDLGTAWDISTAVWQREYTHGVVNPKGLFFSTDGTKMYLGIFNSSDVKRYPLTTAWNVSTVGSTDQSYSTGDVQDLWFSSDGTKMFWSDNSGNVKKLVLGTAWTINSNTSGSQTVNPSDITGIGALQFKPDGTRMFLGGWDSSGRIKQYALATAFDLSTVSFTQEYNASAQTSDMQGMALSATGDKFFVLDQTNDYIRQYDADTAIPATWTKQVSSTPPTVAGLKLHLDSSDASTITKDGSNLVSAWNDKSGQANHVVQATGSKQPLWVDRLQDTLPIIRFDGTDDFLKIASWSGGALATSTSYMVFKPDVAGTQTWFDSAINRTVWGGGGGSVPFQIYAGAVLASSVYVADGETIYCQIVSNGASSIIRRDGITIATGNAGSQSFNGIYLGSGQNTAYSEVDVAELLVYEGTHSTSDRDAIEAYLKKKWGL